MGIPRTRIAGEIKLPTQRQWILTKKISPTPEVDGETRFVACDAKATELPSALIVHSVLSAFA